MLLDLYLDRIWQWASQTAAKSIGQKHRGTILQTECHRSEVQKVVQGLIGQLARLSGGFAQHPTSANPGTNT